MQKTIIALLFLLAIGRPDAQAQEIETLFRSSRPSGGYIALSNKFSTIKGEYANIAELYGGYFIHRRFLLGLGFAATTNNLQVPLEFSTRPNTKMSWQYGQAGLMTEYVFLSNKVLHFNLTFFGGGGFTAQYERTDVDNWNNDFDDETEHDVNFFPVIEPGAQIELNVFKWMRLSPGISYRKTFGSEGMGLPDGDLSNWSYNVTLKFGKF